MAARSKFPYGDKYDEVLKEGERVARARYYQDVSSSAEEIVKDHKENGTDLYDLISESSDSAVTYTKTALDIMVESDNWTAIEDQGMELPSDNVAKVVTVIAYYAYHQDLTEAVSRYAEEHDIDIESNPSPGKKSSKKAAKKRVKKRAKKR